MGWIDEPRIRLGNYYGQGGRAAAPIFGRFMQKTYKDSTIGLPLEYLFSRKDYHRYDFVRIRKRKLGMVSK